MSGLLGLSGLKVTGDVQDILSCRLYGGDYGAHYYYNRGLLNAKEKRSEADCQAYETVFEEGLRAGVYEPLANCATYDGIGGMWWKHEEQLPVQSCRFLIAADAAHFLLTMPTVIKLVIYPTPRLIKKFLVVLVSCKLWQ